MRKKKAISPVVATVLLVAIVIVIGLIIFLWFKGMIGESVTKFDENIELVCEDVLFEASYEGGELTLSNIGNVPIYDIKVKKFSAGNHDTESLREEITSWPGGGLGQGGLFSTKKDYSSSTKILLIPVLIGSSEKGEKSFTCNDRYGKEIEI